MQWYEANKSSQLQPQQPPRPPSPLPHCDAAALTRVSVDITAVAHGASRGRPVERLPAHSAAAANVTARGGYDMGVRYAEHRNNGGYFCGFSGLRRCATMVGGVCLYGRYTP